MSDIFNTDPTFGGAFAMDEAVMTFTVGNNPADDGGLGQLVQSVNVQYSRAVQRIYELGPNKTTYYVIGRAEGGMSIGRLAAPAPVQEIFLETFADVCKVHQNTLSIYTSAGIKCEQGDEDSLVSLANPKAKRSHFSYCLINSVGFQMSVQSLALSENISLTFARMETENVAPERRPIVV